MLDVACSGFNWLTSHRIEYLSNKRDESSMVVTAGLRDDSNTLQRTLNPSEIEHKS